jgi:hypothetical protein
MFFYGQPLVLYPSGFIPSQVFFPRWTAHRIANKTTLNQTPKKARAKTIFFSYKLGTLNAIACAHTFVSPKKIMQKRLAIFFVPFRLFSVAGATEPR